MERHDSHPNSSDLAGSLAELGLTPAEGEVYTFLLAESPSTGYRIAQAIGRPVGNVYKAVEALEAKGAVVVADDDDHRVARAVPIEAFAAQVKRRIDRACEAAVRAGTPDHHDEEFDDRVYRLTNLTQFQARAQSLVGEARAFVLAMGAPMAIEHVRAALVDAAAQGIPVAVKSLVPVDMPGVRVVLDARGETALFHAPGHWLTMNADGGQLLDVMLDTDTGEVLTGYWTRNPLMAWSSYTGLYSRLVLEDARSTGELAETASARGDRWAPFETPHSQGKRLMVERFRTPSPGARRVVRKKREGDES